MPEPFGIATHNGMDRRTKAALNKDKAVRLNETWGVGAAQVRYSDDGHWYATLTRFPAALFDARGYVLFPTEEEYRTSPHMSIGKQISVPKPGISAIPGCVRVAESDSSPSLDVDIHTIAATEGRRRLVLHLQRERNQTVVRNKKKQAASLDCEVCGFSFGRAYGSAASDYCEVPPYCHCPRWTTPPEREWKTLPFFAPTAIASFICTTHPTP
jgi:hypothetical protein